MSLGKYRPTIEEDQSAYDGPLSTYKEWHAMTIGFGLGTIVLLALAASWTVAAPVAIVTVKVGYYSLTGRHLQVAGKPVNLPQRYRRQLRAEPHYYLGGVVLGAAFGAAITVLVDVASLPF